MFAKKKETRSLAKIESLIGAGTCIEGKVRFSGGLRIDGEVKGAVEAVPGSDAVLVISDQARIEGAVEVTHLVMNGVIVGPVFVAESLEMQPKSRILGDVTYAAIEIHQGAVIEGRLVHQSAKEPNLPSGD